MSEILELKSQIEGINVKLRQLQNFIYKEQKDVKNSSQQQYGHVTCDAISNQTHEDAANDNLEVDRIRYNQGMPLRQQLFLSISLNNSR